MKNIVCLCILALVLVGCGGETRSTRTTRHDSSELPVWVKHTPTIPGRVYAVGSDQMRVIAIDSAKAEVLAQLQVSIEATRQSDSLLAIQESSSTPRSQQLERTIREKALQRVGLEDVQGLSISNEYIDAQGIHYVLAELDRSLWASSLRQQIGMIDERLLAAWNSFQGQELAQESAVGKALRLHREIVPLATERDLLARRLIIVSPGTQLEAAPVDIAELRALSATLLDSLTIAITADGSLQQLMPEIVNGLAAHGLPVVVDSTKAQLLVDIKLSTNQRTIDGLIRLDGEITGTVRDMTADRHLAGLRAVERSSGDEIQLVQQRLMRRLAPAVAEAIDQALLKRLAP